MKASTNTKQLADALKTVGGAVVTKHPAFRGVTLRATDARITLSATNGAMLVSASIEADVTDEEPITLPHDKLHEIAKALVKFEQVTIDGERITAEGSKYKLASIQRNSVPESDANFGKGVSATVIGNELARMLNDVRCCVANDNSRYAINGIRIEITDNAIRCVTTDGRRMAISKACAVTKGNASFTLPEDAADVAIGLANAAGSDGVTIQFSHERIRIATERGSVETPSLEGSFPPYEDVIPKDRSRCFRVLPADLARVTKRAEVMTNEESRGVRFDIKDEKLVASSRAPEIGEAEIACPVSGATDAITFGVNPEFMLDAAKACEWIDGDLVVSNAKENKPIVVERGTDALFVIMPVSP